MKLQKGDIFRFLRKQLSTWDCTCLYIVDTVSMGQVAFIRHTSCPKHACSESYTWWVRTHFFAGEVEVIDPFELWVEEVRREHGLVD